MGDTRAALSVYDALVSNEEIYHTCFAISFFPFFFSFFFLLSCSMVTWSNGNELFAGLTAGSPDGAAAITRMWGPATGINWCEPDYAVVDWCAEFWNTIRCEIITSAQGAPFATRRPPEILV